MPGLEIIGNEVFFKGKRVQSLTVEGRPFFSSDKGIALENLPAYTVKKVQVSRKKRRMLSGLEDRANTPLEVNIVLKDDMKSGLVGYLTPGYGTDSRFSTHTLEGESTWIKGVAGRMNWALPFGFTLLSDFNCSWYSGFRSDEEPSAVWNAEICKSVLENRIVLSVNGFDLLDKTRNLKTSYADNYVEERAVNVLRRFVLFSLSYKFWKF